MQFDFVASSLDLVESLWTYEIAEQNVSVPFLLVGQSHDPAVTFDRSHVNFRSVLVGQLLQVNMLLLLLLLTAHLMKMKGISVM